MMWLAVICRTLRQDESASIHFHNGETEMRRIFSGKSSLVLMGLSVAVVSSSGCMGLAARSAASRMAAMEAAELAGTGVAVGMVAGEYAQGTAFDPGRVINTTPQPIDQSQPSIDAEKPSVFCTY
jgi:hypothetical protein